MGLEEMYHYFNVDKNSLITKMREEDKLRHHYWYIEKKAVEKYCQALSVHYKNIEDCEMNPNESLEDKEMELTNLLMNCLILQSSSTDWPMSLLEEQMKLELCLISFLRLMKNKTEERTLYHKVCKESRRFTFMKNVVNDMLHSIKECEEEQDDFYRKDISSIEKARTFAKRSIGLYLLVQIEANTTYWLKHSKHILRDCVLLFLSKFRYDLNLNAKYENRDKCDCDCNLEDSLQERMEKEINAQRQKEKFVEVSDVFNKYVCENEEERNEFEKTRQIMKKTITYFAEEFGFK